jgi:hypothetical protein
MRIRFSKAVALGTLAALVLMSGCYERVVGAKGMGAQGVSISKPNGPEGSVTTTTTQKRSLRLDDTMKR